MSKSFSITELAAEFEQNKKPSLNHLTEQQREIYFNHLKYEYGNRGRTFIGMSKAAKKTNRLARPTMMTLPNVIKVLFRENVWTATV